MLPVVRERHTARRAPAGSSLHRPDGKARAGLEGAEAIALSRSIASRQEWRHTHRRSIAPYVHYANWLPPAGLDGLHLPDTLDKLVEHILAHSHRLSRSESGREESAIHVE